MDGLHRPDRGCHESVGAARRIGGFVQVRDAGPVLKGIGGEQVRCRSPVSGLGKGPVKDQVTTGQGHSQLGGGIAKNPCVDQGTATRVLHELVIDGGDWIAAKVNAKRALLRGDPQGLERLGLLIENQAKLSRCRRAHHPAGDLAVSILGHDMVGRCHGLLSLQAGQQRCRDQQEAEGTEHSGQGGRDSWKHQIHEFSCLRPLESHRSQHKQCLYTSCGQLGNNSQGGERDRIGRVDSHHSSPL